MVRQKPGFHVHFLPNHAKNQNGLAPPMQGDYIAFFYFGETTDILLGISRINYQTNQKHPHS
jgi:hypothetical protein